MVEGEPARTGPEGSRAPCQRDVGGGARDSTHWRAEQLDGAASGLQEGWQAGAQSS